MSVSLKINGVDHTLEADEQTPLLWALRDVLGLTGTKFGCGIAACGACTVHVDGKALRSCVVPIASVVGAEVTTIEGLSEASDHPLQEAWRSGEVPQCGYCQSGMIMAAAALLAEKPNPTDEEIDNAMTNICRCGTYPRIRSAIRQAAQSA